MKKIALLLALVLMLTVTLVSCGGNYDDGAPDLGDDKIPENDDASNDVKADVQYDCKYEAYTYNVHNGKTVEITAYDFDYVGDGASTAAAKDEEEIETVEITVPDKIDGLPVTKIGSRAFASNNRLAAITIPEGVTEIADEAFWFNDSLESVELPESLKTLGKRVFNYCPALKTLEIPEGVTEIPAELCDECLALETLTIGSAVTKIASKAFNNCIALETVNFDGDVSALTIENGNDALSEILLGK